MNSLDAQKILGLKNNFTPDELKKAYRSLSKKHHPDVGGRQEDFIKIKTAYELLLVSRTTLSYNLLTHGSIFTIVKV